MKSTLFQGWVSCQGGKEPDTFLKVGLWYAFSFLREEQKILPILIESQLPSSQKESSLQCDIFWGWCVVTAFNCAL